MSNLIGGVLWKIDRQKKSIILVLPRKLRKEEHVYAGTLGRLSSETIKSSRLVMSVHRERQGIAPDTISV